MNMDYDTVTSALDESIREIDDLSRQFKEEDVLKVSSGSIITLKNKNDEIKNKLNDYKNDVQTNIKVMQEIESYFNGFTQK